MAKVLLDANDVYIAASPVTIVGSTGAETVKVYEGVTITADSSVERIELSRASTDYTYKATATGMQVLFNGVVIANLQSGEKIAFTDGSASINVTSDLTTGVSTCTLGGLTVGTTAAPLTGIASAVNPADVTTVPPGTSTTPTTTGQTFTLTTGFDTINGTANNDIFNAVVDSAITTNSTLTALDTINGGDGTDTLNILATAALTLPTGLTVSSVETANLRAGTTIVADASAWTGLTALNSTQSTSSTLTAAATTAVSVTGATTSVAIDGGSTQTVTTAGTTVTLGAATGAAGAINVTHTAQAANAIAIDGGTAVTVTATGNTGGTIGIGQAPVAVDSPIPTGAVTVKSTSTAAVDAAADVTMGAITIDGGSTVTVTQSVNKGTMATTGVTGATVIQGAVAVTAGLATTAVTVTQEKTVGETLAKAAVAAVAATSTVTFKAMTAAAEWVEVNGLRFTANKALSAAEVAAAFANLTASDTQTPTGPVANGVFTAVSSTLGYTTGPATSTGTVTYSGVAGIAALTITSSAAGNLPVATVPTAGVAGVKGVTGVVGVTSGVVAIDDNATTASVKTITLDGYGAATLGAGGSLNALTAMSLANSAATATLTTTVTSLDLTLNKVTGIIVDAAGTIKTLNITTTGSGSATALDAVGVTALTVAGTQAVDLSAGTATLTALKTVTVTGAAGLTLGNGAIANTTSINTTGTTGTVKSFINATVGSYTGGDGVDNLTTTATAGTKAIDLGAGNDSITLAAGVSSVGVAGSIAGGADIDTLIFADTTDAVGNEAALALKITGFERLTLLAGTSEAVDVTALGNYNYVNVTGASALTINKLVSTGTVNLLGANTTTIVSVTDAAVAGHTTDVLNVIATNVTAADDTTNFGTLTAAAVETINITTVDKDATPATATKDIAQLVLVATSATTINVFGDADLALTNTGNVKATLIDAHTMTGALTATLTNTAANGTILGGSGNDVLTASAFVATVDGGDILNGGAGNDKLISTSQISTLTGGAGSDIFEIHLSAGIAKYSHITDAMTGDKIDIHGVDGGASAINMAAFASSKAVINPTGSFADAVNSALTAANTATAADGSAAWFQYATGGVIDTYIVLNGDSAGIAGTLETYNAAQDSLVRLVGTIDLSTASFNATTGMLEIA